MTIECKIRVTWSGTSKEANLKVPIKKIIEYCEDCSMTNYFTHRKFKTYLFHCFSSFTILCAVFGVKNMFISYLQFEWYFPLLLLGYPRPMVGYYALAWLCKGKRIAIPLNIDTPAFCDCDPFVCIYKLLSLKKLHIFLHTKFPFTCSNWTRFHLTDTL